MIVRGACGALQLCCNSLSISSRGSHGLRDHPGFSRLYAPSIAPFPLTSLALCLPGDNLRDRWMALKESSRGAMYVNRLCNSRAWVKCLLNGSPILKETRKCLFVVCFFPDNVSFLFLQLIKSDSGVTVNYWMWEHMSNTWETFYISGIDQEFIYTYILYILYICCFLGRNKAGVSKKTAPHEKSF